MRTTSPYFLRLIKRFIALIIAKPSLHGNLRLLGIPNAHGRMRACRSIIRTNDGRGYSDGSALFSSNLDSRCSPLIYLFRNKAYLDNGIFDYRLSNRMLCNFRPRKIAYVKKIWCFLFIQKKSFQMSHLNLFRKLFDKLISGEFLIHILIYCIFYGYKNNSFVLIFLN